jgi:outer membrane receptor for ferrienterochelin and colicins
MMPIPPFIKKLLSALALALPVYLTGQSITGKVLDEQAAPLVGATVYWQGENIVAITGERGEFKIPAPAAATNKYLIARYVGYAPDTLDTTISSAIEFRLKPIETLSEVVVKGKRQGVIISDIRTIKTEQITQAELTKAACCDLAGCFETQSTVQPQTTNVITNSKELRILGLSGVYNQVLIDGLPMIQGLSYTYGISSIPGTLVDNIYVAKGANSVLQGFESLSGQINVETKEPDQTDRLLLNAYINSFSEKHFNANYAFKKGKWSNLTTVHTVQPANKTDRDGDAFLDLPLLTRYAVSNKWKYGNEKEWGWHSRIGLRYLHEQRIGGQLSFDPVTDKGSSRAYGQSVQLKQPEIWTKTGYRLNDQHHFVFFASAFRQEQLSYFGTVRYDARQTNFYANIQYEFTYATHDLKTGASFRYLNLDEDIAFTGPPIGRRYEGNYLRLEKIPGFFAENTLRLFNGKVTWIAGLRADHLSPEGFRITPRTLLKYDIAPRTIVRANIGTGWRTVNLFSENIGLLVSSRDIRFAEPLRPESALNMGINFTQKFETANQQLSGYFSADFYSTRFQNQIFPDYDTDPTLAIIQNFTGTSVSNGFQAEGQVQLFGRLEVKTGYSFLDVYRENGENKLLLPFNPRHKVLTSLSFQPLNGKFHLDANIHTYGQQRLPNTQNNPALYRRPDFSRPYTVANAQFTFNFGKFEVYAGCENIFDFRQLQPILAWQDPFGPFFDTSSVWGPTRGRELYTGLRIKWKGE